MRISTCIIRRMGAYGRLRLPTYGENLGGAGTLTPSTGGQTAMTMLLDGKAVYRYTGEGIPSTSMYIVLSNGVMKGEKPGPGSMLVDYVRVWQ